jgi:transcriptional regulator of heat shock response
MIDERKIELMTRVVDEYITSAHPVGSLVLVERYRLTWSTATIRNEMAVLEEAGYMFQPYTSSGRVPTQRGYRLYIQHMRPAKLSTRAVSQVQEAFHSLDSMSSRSLKEFACMLADASGEIAFVYSGENIAISGMQNLCGKPEFYDAEFMEEVVGILDTLEDTLEDISDELGNDLTLFIGDAKHFGRTCSVLVVSVLVHKTKTLIGVLGPLRMNYSKNMALLELLSHSSNT